MKTLEHKNKDIIEKTIRECDICFVGMAGKDGTPYVLPMNFGYSQGVVFLHSAQEGHSIDILQENPKVCLVFNPKNKLVWQHPDVGCSYRMQSSSVIAWGSVAFEEDFERKVKALDILMKQYSEREFKYSDPSVVNVKIWRVELEKITCKEFGAPHKKQF